MAAHTLSHVVESLEWLKGAEAKGGAGRLGLPGFPPPESLSNLSGPWENDEGGHRASCATDLLGDLGQVPASLQASVSPSVVSDHPLGTSWG